jgi:hypothetical protein
MILLHSGIGRHLDGWAEASGASLPETMSEEAQADLDALRDATGNEIDVGLAAWVSEAYPQQIDAWERIGDAAPFRALAQSVVDQLEGQLMVARRVLEGDGELTAVGEDVSRVLAWGGRIDGADRQTAAAAGEGQTGERQHTPSTESAAVQSGGNYRHDQVETDPQTATRALGEAPGDAGTARPAGELDNRNPAGLFAALANPRLELQQLASASGLTADRVRVVPAEEVMASADAEAIGTAGEREESMRRMRRAVGDHEVLSKAVGDAGAALDDVIAIDVLDEGVIVYTVGGEQQAGGR